MHVHAHPIILSMQVCMHLNCQGRRLDNKALSEELKSIEKQRALVV